MSRVDCSAIASLDLAKRQHFPSSGDPFDEVALAKCSGGGCECTFPFEYEGVTHWGCIPKSDGGSSFCCAADYNPGDCAVQESCDLACPLTDAVRIFGEPNSSNSDNLKVKVAEVLPTAPSRLNAAANVRRRLRTSRGLCSSRYAQRVHRSVLGGWWAGFGTEHCTCARLRTNAGYGTG